jgi:glutaredoxin 3
MKKDIKIYSTPTCHFCHMAKDFFSENNIEYTEFDVAADAEKRAEMMEKTGQMGVPVIEIGDEVIIGFNEAKVKELISAE